MVRSREGYLWASNQISRGLDTDAVAADTPSLKNSYDVVVIGAGFAGLIAARDLAQQWKLNVLLVEGRDRIGGRTWTANALGEQFEMGGTWVHWHQPNVYSEMQRYGLHRNLKTSAGNFAPQKMFYKPNGGAIQVATVDAKQLNNIAARFFQIDGHDSRTLMPYPHDPLRQPAPWRDYDHMTIKQRLDQLTDIPQSDRDYFETYTNTMGGAPGEGTAFVEFLRWYALSGHTMTLFLECVGIYKLGKGGMTSFANAILNDYSGDRIFNTVVSSIQERDSAVDLIMSDGRQIRAKAAISTILLNCLSDIEFSPPLSALRQAAVDIGHINKGAKIHFKLSELEPAWFGSCDYGQDHPYSFAFVDHSGSKQSGPDGSYCVGFGYNGRLLDPKDDKEIIQQFKKSFNENAQVEAYLTHDWMNDPLAKGVWSCWNTDTMSKYLEELQKPHGRVLFASADWADGWRGFIDGAIERGCTAAKEAVKALEEDR